MNFVLCVCGCVHETNRGKWQTGRPACPRSTPRTRLPQPLGLPAREKCVDDDLRAVGEIPELRLPDALCVARVGWMV